MATDPVAFFIGAPDDTHLGPDHSAEVTRQFIYDATGGAEGVSHPTAMKVLPLFTPGGGVRVLPGGGLLNNRHEGGDGQSYAARNATQTEVTVPATSSAGGRTDLVVCRILDPQYEGQPPTDPNDFEYTRIRLIQDVPVGTETAAELNLGYPAIELARIDQPASTNTVTEERITRLHKLALPKQETVPLGQAILSGDNGLTLSAFRTAGNGGRYWPNTGGEFFVDIPVWATRCIVKAKWHGVNIEANKNPFGAKWVEFGPKTDTSDRAIKMQEIGFNSTNTSDVKRDPIWGFFGKHDIPSDYQGTRQGFVMKARYNGADDGVYMDGYSATEMDIIFQQTVDHSPEA